METLLLPLLFTVGVIVITSMNDWLSRKKRAINNIELDRLSSAYQRELEVERVKALSSIPSGLSVEQFKTLLVALAKAPTSQPPVESLISNYHAQALSQARVQFYLSVVAAVVGFGWIIYAGLGINPSDLSTAMATLPGIAIDTVAFLFFRQAAETRQRATDLYDRLRRDKQLDGSVHLVSSIEDVRIRSAVKAQIALHMSGLKPKDIDLSTFLSGQDSSSLSE